MSRKLEFDPSGRVQNPTFVLGTKSGRKLGQITAIDDCVVHQVMNGANEISFVVYKHLDTIVNPLWDDIVDFKTIWFKEADEWFEISVDLTDDDTMKKSVTAKSLCESELSQVNLNGVEINTEDDIARDDYTEPTIFYNGDNHNASLLHRMLDKVPNYSVGHVDDSLKSVQRKFSFDGDSVYDALMDVSEEVECLFIFDSSTNSNGVPARVVNAYDLKQYCRKCGNRFESGSVCPKCGSAEISDGYGDDTGIVVMKDMLSDDISYSTSQDDVKNCFRLEAGDDLMTAAIRSCNPNGSSYIWYITDDIKKDMSSELVNKLDHYNALYSEYQSNHNFSISSEQYNSLVDKYKGKDDALRHILSGGSSENGAITLSKFPSVVEAYYSSYDFGSFLQTSMMPTMEMSDTSVDKEIKKLEDGLRTVAVTSLSDSTSLSTFETAIKSIAKLYIYSGKYNVTVNSKSWNNPTWVGTITLTNWGDDEDTATTKELTVTASGDMETYVNQIIEKRLSNVESDKYDIVSLFHMEDEEFKSSLKLYSLDCLKAFQDSCQTCIDVLIEQGCSDPAHYMYGKSYIPWVQKMDSITTEVDVRDSELKIITGDDGMIHALEKIMEAVHKELDFQNYIGSDLWNEFIAYRREDEYSNSNYISDGLTNSELIANAQEFISSAEKELFKSAELQHEIKASLYNILAMPEFSALVDNFAVGNWIWIIVDDVPYRLRLTEYEIDFSDLQNIDVEFSDVTRQLGGLSDVQSILDSASKMATSYGYVSHQASLGDAADKEVSSWVQTGLDATNVKIISSATNEETQIDGHGILSRRYDDILENYRPEQVRLISSTLAFTDDNWATIKTALGLIVNDNGESVYGLIADNIIGKMIAGENLVIQSAPDENGNTLFKVGKDGVSIKIKDDKGNISELNDTINGLTTTVKNVDQNIDTKFSQLADSITLSASNENNEVSISLTVGEEEKRAKIDMKGYPIFTPNLRM